MVQNRILSIELQVNRVASRWQYSSGTGIAKFAIAPSLMTVQWTANTGAAPAGEVLEAPILVRGWCAQPNWPEILALGGGSLLSARGVKVGRVTIGVTPISAQKSTMLHRSCFHSSDFSSETFCTTKFFLARSTSGRRYKYDNNLDGVALVTKS